MIIKNESQWIKKIGECPQQRNFYDCGVLMLIQLQRIALNDNIFFISDDIAEERKIMGVQLLAGKLFMKQK